MTDRLRLVARWRGRQESAEECATRAVRLLDRLRSLDEAFHRWFATSTSRASALAQPVAISQESLADRLAAGRATTDSDRSVIEDLGFTTSVWNGSEGIRAATMLICCGAYPDPEFIPFPNELLMTLPYGDSNAHYEATHERLTDIVKAVVENWDPDWASISTEGMQTTVHAEDFVGHDVGWCTYMSDRCGALPELPSDCDAYRIAGGTMIVATQIARLDSRNPEHVDFVRRLSDRLDRAGLLQTLRPKGR